MVKKIKVKSIYLVNLLCDKCGKEMISSGFVIMTAPPQIQYNCECGHSITTSKKYPSIEYEYEENENAN